MKYFFITIQTVIIVFQLPLHTIRWHFTRNSTSGREYTCIHAERYTVL